MIRCQMCGQDTAQHRAPNDRTGDTLLVCDHCADHLWEQWRPR